MTTTEEEPSRTWGMSFEIKNGKLDPSTVVHSGTIPDGKMTMSGYNTEDAEQVDLTMGALHAGGWRDKTMDSKPDEKAGG